MRGAAVLASSSMALMLSGTVRNWIQSTHKSTVFLSMAVLVMAHCSPLAPPTMVIGAPVEYAEVAVVICGL